MWAMAQIDSLNNLYTHLRPNGSRFAVFFGFCNMNPNETLGGGGLPYTIIIPIMVCEP